MTPTLVELLSQLILAIYVVLIALLVAMRLFPSVKNTVFRFKGLRTFISYLRSPG